MIFDYFQNHSLELIAVLLAILYLLLAVRQNILCWPAGIISSVLYFFIMNSAGLYMEAYLQIFYVFMGLYVVCVVLYCFVNTNLFPWLKAPAGFCVKIDISERTFF